MPVALAPETVPAGAEPAGAARQRRERFVRQYGLPDYDAKVLVADKAVADFYEEAARRTAHAKLLSNWVMTEMLRGSREGDGGARREGHAPALAALVDLVAAGT